MPSLGGWEWVILLFGTPVLVIVLVVVLVVRSNKRAKMQQQAMFSGVFTADTVNYQLAFGAPPYPAVVAEATRRGYRLVGQTPAGMLTFTR